MHIWQEWNWKNRYTPRELLSQPNRIVKIEDIRIWKTHIPEERFVTNPLVFITGDGSTLAKDVREFESWNVPHDLYCVNRSLLYFQRQVDHWCAIDAEEAAWFSENCTANNAPCKSIIRHTIGEGAMMFDVWWERVFPFTDDYQRRVWIGNSGYFAVLTAIKMGYSKIVLAAMPLDGNNHWYEPSDKPGPQWNPLCYSQWEDFSEKIPEAKNIRSMGGKTAEILGQATKEWARDVGFIGLSN